MSLETNDLKKSRNRYKIFHIPKSKTGKIHRRGIELISKSPLMLQVVSTAAMLSNLESRKDENAVEYLSELTKELTKVDAQLDEITLKCHEVFGKNAADSYSCETEEKIKNSLSDKKFFTDLLLFSRCTFIDLFCENPMLKDIVLAGMASPITLRPTEEAKKGISFFGEAAGNAARECRPSLVYRTAIVALFDLFYAANREAACGSDNLRTKTPPWSDFVRTICAPDRETKERQYHWMEKLQKVPLHPAAFGFIKFRNAFMCAEEHSKHWGRKTRISVLNHDLKNFFPSVSEGDIKSSLERAGLAESSEDVIKDCMIRSSWDLISDCMSAYTDLWNIIRKDLSPKDIAECENVFLNRIHMASYSITAESRDWICPRGARQGHTEGLILFNHRGAELTGVASMYNTEFSMCMNRELIYSSRKIINKLMNEVVGPLYRVASKAHALYSVSERYIDILKDSLWEDLTNSCSESEKEKYKNLYNDVNWRKNIFKSYFCENLKNFDKPPVFSRTILEAVCAMPLSTGEDELPLDTNIEEVLAKAVLFKFGNIRSHSDKNKSYAIAEDYSIYCHRLLRICNGVNDFSSLMFGTILNSNIGVSNKRFLPQGSPCSPVLSNIAFASMDARIAGLAKSMGFYYARYADDMTFSTPYPQKNKAFEQLSFCLKGLLRDQGYEINEAKTLRRGPSKNIDVVGYSINTGRARVNGRYRKKLRAIIHSEIFKTGTLSKRTEGMIAFVRSGDPFAYIKYIEKLKRHLESGAVNISREDVERRLARIEEEPFPKDSELGIDEIESTDDDRFEPERSMEENLIPSHNGEDPADPDGFDTEDIW